METWGLRRNKRPCIKVEWFAKGSKNMETWDLRRNKRPCIKS
jgi:hypothetical protein